MNNWLTWALLSAGFAALTALFAKVGVTNVNPDFATFIRTVIILIAFAGILLTSGGFQPLGSISARSYVFLCLSGLATGASWLCYFRALKLGAATQVVSIDRMSVALVAILGVVFLGEKLSAANWFGILLITAGAVLVVQKV